MNKFVSNNPLSLWRFLIVSATIFIVMPIAATSIMALLLTVTAVMALFLPQFYLEIPILAEIISITYVNGNVQYLVPIFGLLYGYGLWHKRTSTDVARMTPIALPFSIALTIGIFNKALLILTIIGASIVALDASVFDGIMLFIATCVAAGSGAAIKHALIDAAHPSQSLSMIGATGMVLLASWLASSSSVAYDGVILLGGYWAPAVGCLIGLTSQIESPAVFISNRNAGTFSAAEQGDAGAQFNLGTMYYNGHYNGQSVIKDYKEAVKWYRLAAEQGHAQAQYYLGSMYYYGKGVAQDYKEAAKWYRLAAEQGVAEAQYDLAYMYAAGKGVAEDDKEAVKWYRLAAEQGDSSAQFQLGWMYTEGKGVVQDNKQAVKWTRLAAEQGDSSAQFQLGRMYTEGKGVVQDNKEAIKWYRLAAEQGNSFAQFQLGGMYAEGEGVIQDYVMAHMCWTIAGDSGYLAKEAIKSRGLIEKDMAPSQIAEAQKLAREWMKKHQ